MSRASGTQPTQRDVASAATKALITAQGGMRFCASCQRLKPAETFTKLRTRRGAIIRREQCTAKQPGGAR